MRKTDIEMARTIAIKRLRNRVRLEASIRADLALNELLPEFEAEFGRRLETGEPYELASYEASVVEAVNKVLPPAELVGAGVEGSY